MFTLCETLCVLIGERTRLGKPRACHATTRSIFLPPRLGALPKVLIHSEGF
jgi:hypothetical protein